MSLIIPPNVILVAMILWAAMILQDPAWIERLDDDDPKVRDQATRKLIELWQDDAVKAELEKASQRKEKPEFADRARLILKHFQVRRELGKDLVDLLGARVDEFLGPRDAAWLESIGPKLKVEEWTFDRQRRLAPFLMPAIEKYLEGFHLDRFPRKPIPEDFWWVYVQGLSSEKETTRRKCGAAIAQVARTADSPRCNRLLLRLADSPNAAAALSAAVEVLGWGVSKRTEIRLEQETADVLLARARAVLKDADKAVRWNAANAVMYLARLPTVKLDKETARSLLRDLFDRLNDSDAGVRSYLAVALRNTLRHVDAADAEELARLLMQRLADKDEILRQSAAYTLGEIADCLQAETVETSARELTRIAEDRNPEVRLSVAWAFEYIGSGAKIKLSAGTAGAAMDALIRTIRKPELDDWRLARATSALGRLVRFAEPGQWEELLPVLAEGLKGNGGWAVVESALALGRNIDRLAPKDKPILEEALRRLRGLLAPKGPHFLLEEDDAVVLRMAETLERLSK